MAGAGFALWQRRYADALRLLGADAAPGDPLARADALWLARVLPLRDGGAAATASATAQPPPSRTAARPPASRPEAMPPMPPAPPGHAGAPPTTSLFAPQPGMAGDAQLKARRVPVPVADALPGRAAIERALKPFLRRRPSPLRSVVDAEATAEASANATAELLTAAPAAGARAHAIVPVLRPVAERWFDVVLLAERDEAMLAFEDTLTELRDLMAHHGAFAQVRLWRYAVHGGAVVVHSPAGMPCGPRAMLLSQKPQLVLVLTHGASPHWEQPVLRAFVRDLARRAVVAIVQMLPRTAWSFTALGEAPERVRSRERGAPNRLLQRLDAWRGLYVDRKGADTVPVLALDPQGVAGWAGWLMSARLRDHAAVALDVPAAPPAGEPEPGAAADAAAHGDAEDAVRARVLRFRAVASEQAFALLRLLAAAWVTLPLMRLLANALPGPRSGAPLAEVLLSGLLVRESPPGVPAHELVFDFVPGVREWLHGSLSSDEQRRANAAMAASRESIRRFVEEKTGVRMASFDALLLDPRGTELLPASAQSFVEVSRKLRSLRGLPVGAAAPAAPPHDAGGALHDFPLPARDLVPRPRLEAEILQRVLALRIGAAVGFSALPGSGASMLMARVLAHAAVRHRYPGGIWFGTEPPPREPGDRAPRLHLALRRGSGSKAAGDTRIHLVWPRDDDDPDIGHLVRTEVAAYYATLGLPGTQVRRLEPLHRGMPLLVQLLGVGTALGVARWPRVAAATTLGERFRIYAKALLQHLPPEQVETLVRLAARRPGFPAGGPPLPGAELAPRLGWLCPGAAGAADTLHPDISRRLESIEGLAFAEAHATLLRELRANLERIDVAAYVRRYLIDHAEAAGGANEVCRALFDRRRLAVLLGAGGPALLGRLQPLAKKDERIAAFAGRLAQVLPPESDAHDAQALLEPAVLDAVRAVFAPPADWRARMAVDVAHRANLTGSGVRVAIVATGVDADHPELQHLAVAGDTADPQGHGTEVASIVAGRFVGIAPGVRLWSLAALDAQGRGTTSTLLTAFDRIAGAPATERPDIVCLPLGMDGADSPAMTAAISRLIELGVVVVAAGGNEGRPQLSFPASLPQIVAVGALTPHGKPAPFNNGRSDGPSLWAPGVDVVVASPERTTKAGAAGAAPYRERNGTSFACAAVVGLAALYAQATGLRGPALRELLIDTAVQRQARFVAAEDLAPTALREQAAPARPPGEPPDTSAGMPNAVRDAPQAPAASSANAAELERLLAKLIATAVEGRDAIAARVEGGPELVLHPEVVRFAGGATRFVRGAKLRDARILNRDPAETRDFASTLAEVDAPSASGVYAVGREALFPLRANGRALGSVPPSTAGGPLLVLIHGLCADTATTFGLLWSLHRAGVDALFERYGAVYALEHPALAGSAVASAERLARALPHGARLHLASHGSGAMVTELLACAAAPGERSIPASGDTPAVMAGLQSLVALVRQKELRVERVVRVAGPPYGVPLPTYARLDLFLSLLAWSLEASGASAPSPALRRLLAEVARQNVKPQRLLGLAQWLPGSPLNAWLRAGTVPVPGDLRIVSAPWAGREIAVALADLVDDPDATAHPPDAGAAPTFRSAGRAGGTLVRRFEGETIAHHGYFDDATVAQAFADALLADAPPGFERVGESA